MSDLKTDEAPIPPKPAIGFALAVLGGGVVLLLPLVLILLIAG
jgi:hypothetical protein